jgi:hypothetical protein
MPANNANANNGTRSPHRTLSTSLIKAPASSTDSTTGTDTDIDQFQETAFFPGTPVAAVHATTARDWWFVIGPTYAGWVAADSIALGDRGEVLAYAARASRVVTAARAATAFTPDLPAVCSWARLPSVAEGFPPNTRLASLPALHDACCVPYPADSRNPSPTAPRRGSLVNL